MNQCWKLAVIDWSDLLNWIEMFITAIVQLGIAYEFVCGLIAVKRIPFK